MKLTVHDRRGGDRRSGNPVTHAEALRILSDRRQGDRRFRTKNPVTHEEAVRILSERRAA